LIVYACTGSGTVEKDRFCIVDKNLEGWRLGVILELIQYGGYGKTYLR
jgi:hypothetical protein